ncbi:MAG TPA: amidohydrolase family protein [Thermoleophilaceae bacterium]|nr:amidohydrolase family protein [Thermoleophilaceae bacterium]
MNAGELFQSFFESSVGALGDVDLFDAHTHTGSNDPDGRSFSLAELLETMASAGSRAVFFTMHEPSGYPEANDRVLAEARESDGRLVPFCRVNPHDDAVAEARRCLDNGARGIKLHPRAEQFTLDHPAVDGLFALAEERGVPILIHAGRGIPALGRHVIEHATDHPGANVILAHAGICDLAWIWRRAAERPNVYYDTSWWNPADLITLYSLVPPSQILYGSDAPYGRPLMSVTLAVRCGLQAGLTVEQMQGVMGGQLARLLDGEAPLDLGSPNGNGTAEVDLLLERVASCLVFSIGPAFGGVPPLVAEGLALARLACEVGDEAPQADVCQAVLDLLDQFDEMGGAETARRGTIQLGLIILALCVARTGNVPLPHLGDGKSDVSERVG